MLEQAVDVLVETNNPQRLDGIIQQFGAALVGGPDNFIKHEGYNVMRVFGDPGFIEFMLASQGYGTVIRRLDHLL